MAVQVNHDGRDEGAGLHQRVDKRRTAGEVRAADDQRHQHLAGRVRRAHQHMAHDAAPRILVIRRQTKPRHEMANRRDDLVCALILDQALLHRDDFTRARRINAADDLALAA